MSPWFSSRSVAPGITLMTEPAVNDFYRANLYTIAGRDADLQFDFGCGIVPLRPSMLPSDRPVIAVASHAHIDHTGAFHEYADRRGHPAEAAGFATVTQNWTLKDGFRANRFGPSLLHAPTPDFDLAAWDLTPAPLTTPLAEGDKIDLGDRRFTVLHLPGHSPGGIGLLDTHDGILLSGDAIYDDRLLDGLPGSSLPDYLATMARLAQLDCRLVLGGHGDPFGPDRLQQIARDYIALRG